MDIGKWTYNYVNSSEYWDCDEKYDTKEEAISAARKYAKDYAEDNLPENEINEYLEDGTFDVAQITAVTYSIDGDSIIEKISEQFYEQCGEACEGWLEEPRNPMWAKEGEKVVLQEKRKKYREQINNLESRLHDTVEKWLVDTNNQPNFFSLEKIQTIYINPNK